MLFYFILILVLLFFPLCVFLRIIKGYFLCAVCAQHAQRLYRHVYLTCREASSGRGHYQALFTLLAVVSVELANEEVLVDLIRLVLALQVIPCR